MHKSLLLGVFLMFQFNLIAQVTIGSGKTPESFSILEIDSKSGGLRYPQMTTPVRNLLALTDSKAHGLMIFNTSEQGLEYYAENLGWINLSTSEMNESPGTQVVIHNGGNETIGSILSYNFSLVFSSITNISDLRVGSYLDANNLVLDVEGSILGNISSTCPIKVNLSLDKVQALTEAQQSELIFYAIYEEKGHDKRIEFSIDLP